MNWYDAMEEAYKKGYDKGQEDAKPKWIPVTERLPEDDAYVLVSANNGIVVHGQIYPNRYSDTGYAVRFGEACLNCATHWMPMPEPPKD